jgi:hypothetical protein
MFKNLLDNYLLVYVDKLLKRPNIKNGFIETTPAQIEKRGDFVYEPERLGFVFKQPHFANVDLSKYRPTGEQQNAGFEKMHCVSESACNTIETNVNYLIKMEEADKADKAVKELLKIFRYFGLVKGSKCLLDTNYVAIGSGTTMRGNTLERVSDFIRHYGLVPKGSVPDGANWNTHYFRPGVRINGNSLPADILARGKKLVDFIEFNYEWVSPKNFGATYQYGAIQTSGCMPSPMKNGIHQYTPNAKNHAIMTDHQTAEYKGVFDSYNPFEKKMAHTYNFGHGMLYTASVKKPLNIFNEAEIAKLRKRGLNYVLLVEDLNDEYKNGAYRLNNGMLEKVADIKPFIDNGVIKLKDDGKLVGINRDDFRKLFML